jgi:hypothetical protein
VEGNPARVWCQRPWRKHSSSIVEDDLGGLRIGVYLLEVGAVHFRLLLLGGGSESHQVIRHRLPRLLQNVDELAGSTLVCGATEEGMSHTCAAKEPPRVLYILYLRVL